MSDTHYTSLLTSVQKNELCKCIAQYLSANSYEHALKGFLKDLDAEAASYDLSEEGSLDGALMLEKKWVSVLRLQRQVLQLEQKLKEVARPSTSQGSIQTVNIEDWYPEKAKFSLLGHKRPVTSLAFHPCLNLIASSSEDMTIRIWDLDSASCEAVLQGHTRVINDLDYSLPMGPENKVLLASCSSDLLIKLWDSCNNNIKTLHGHEHTVSSVRFFGSSSEWIASCARDNTIRVWSTTTGSCNHVFRNAHSSWIRTLEISTDSQYMASGGSDKTAVIWTNSPTQECDWHIYASIEAHTQDIESIAWAPSAANQELTAYSRHHNIELIGDSLDSSLNISSRYRFLATGSRDRSLKLWEIKSRKCIAELNGHDNWIRSINFHPLGKFLLSASDDKTIKVWSIKRTGIFCIHTLHDAHSHFITCIKWSLYLSTDQNLENPVKRQNLPLRLASGSVDQRINIYSIR